MWFQGQWEALTNAFDGANKQTNEQTDGRMGNSMTESAQWGRFSENEFEPLKKNWDRIFLKTYILDPHKKNVGPLQKKYFRLQNKKKYSH